MTFDVTATAYDRFMGRFSQPLAEKFVDAAGVRVGQRALDVGCGPGALTEQLVGRLGLEAVQAIDPSASFVAAARERFPGLDVQEGVAERLPFADDTYEVVLAQLVVLFMADPVAGLREMARVARPGAVVGACVWDHAGASGPLSLFWRAACDVGPAARTESGLPGSREGHLAELCRSADMNEVEASSLTVRVGFSSFEDWWEPFTFGVGPAGAYLARLDEQRLEEVRRRCEQLLPTAPFELDATAWCTIARP